jgi:hypothetical protein
MIRQPFWIVSIFPPLLKNWDYCITWIAWAVNRYFMAMNIRKDEMWGGRAGSMGGIGCMEALGRGSMEALSLGAEGAGALV